MERTTQVRPAREQNSPETEQRNRPASELLFEQYLSERNLKWEYESHGGRRQPDYRVGCAGAVVVLEVKEFREPAKRPLGWFTVCPAIRAKIHDAHKQLREYRDQACGVVLHNTGSLYRGLDVMSVASACFGQYFRREPEVTSSDQLSWPSYEFFGKTALRTDQNTTIAAVMILAPYRLDDLWLEAFRKYQAQPTRGTAAERHHVDLMSELASSVVPRYRFEGTTRLIVLHNPHARIPVALDLFQGPFDQHWGLEDGRYRVLWLGPMLRELENQGVPHLLL